MVSHILKIDLTYPKQVREEEEELETREQSSGSRSSEPILAQARPFSLKRESHSSNFRLTHRCNRLHGLCNRLHRGEYERWEMRMFRMKNLGPYNCKLFLDTPCTPAVAIDMVYNTQDAMIRNAQIPSNHLKVSIDISIEDDALLPIPVVEDIITIRLDLGIFVAWPKHLIDVVPIMGKVSADHSAKSPPRIDEPASKKAKVVKSKPQSSKSNLESSGEVAPIKTNYCEIIWDYVQNSLGDSTIIISIPSPIYGFLAMNSSI
ncbi:hypothetical protein Lal_00032138 [Lupinus albus]|nr:hypothetical protein Lal_00032138 [Lupinus albus]